jgi:hypothetical protein
VKAGDLEHGPVAEAAEALDARLVGLPGDHDTAVVERLQAVRLGLVDGAAEPGEVVGEATGTGGRAPFSVVLALPALRHAGGADQRHRERAEPVRAAVN